MSYAAPGLRAVSLTTSLVLPATVAAPGCARAALRDALAQWGLRHLTDLAEAVASELVANAVTASTETALGDATPAPVTLWITVQGGQLLIRVWDPDPAPVPRDHQPGSWDENGRGLMIVKALSRRWDWDPAEDGGKYVWALCALEAPDCIPGLAGRNLEDIPGSMAYLAPKGKGNLSMPLKRWPGPGTRDGVPQDPRNMSES